MSDQLKIVGGDFVGSFAMCRDKHIFVHTKSSFMVDAHPYDSKYPASMVASVEIVTEDNKARVGLILATGGLGLLAGPRKEITALIRFRDGKKLLATMSSDAYKKIVAMSL
jgi:hypothetical protein